MGSVAARRPSHRGLLVALAALASGCATAGDTVPPPSPFHGVRRAALVRRVPGRDRRPKDPLDALAESLAARGVSVRVVELGPDAPRELAPAARLFDDLDARARSAAAARSRTAEDLGAGAGEVVRGLGVDAVVTYHRMDERWRGAEPLPPPGIEGPYARPAAPYHPLGALVLVGIGGEALILDWGPRDEQLDPAAPQNAAEAVEAAVRALVGEPDAG